jgi:SAM-dependent methyltransferase
MNQKHSELCSSAGWASFIGEEIVPSVIANVHLGDELLELGPGPGAATERLRKEVGRLTALEVDEDAAGKLAEKYAGGNVRVEVGSGAELPFADASFDSVASFTMLHHVPTAELQNRLLAEAHRVLRPAGVLVGSDSLPSTHLHEFHAGDTYNPVDPAAFLVRLQTVGFGRIRLWVDELLRFVAYKPDEDQEKASH